MHSLRTFYLLALTQFFSLIGSRMTGVAIGIYVFEETGNTSPLMIAAFFAEVPGILLGSFTGFLADRFDRRHVMIAGDIGQALGTLLLMVSFLSGAFELWHLYAMMLMQGIFRTVQAPAAEASIAMLVPEDHRDRANGITEMGFNMAGVVAPVFTGLLYTITSIESVMALDLLTFVVAMIVVFSLHIPRPEPEAHDEEQSFWQELTGGWRYLLQHRALLVMVLYLSFTFFLINGPLGLDVPYLMAITGNTATLGLLMGAWSGGAFAGALALTVFGKVEQRMQMIFACYFLHGFMFLLYGVTRQPVLLGIVVFLLMFPLPPAGAMFRTVLQNRVHPARQGRVFAITGQLFVAFTPFSFLLTGWLVDQVLEPAVGKSGWDIVEPLVGSQTGSGMGLLMLIVGVIILATTSVIYAQPVIRNLEANGADSPIGEVAMTQAVEV